MTYFMAGLGVLVFGLDLVNMGFASMMMDNSRSWRRYHLELRDVHPALRPGPPDAGTCRAFCGDAGDPALDGVNFAWPAGNSGSPALRPYSLR